MLQDARVTNLEEALRKRLETLTNYGDQAQQIQKLQKTFSFFDTDSSGLIEFAEFFAAMTRLNFVGVQVYSSALSELHMNPRPAHESVLFAPLPQCHRRS